MTSEINKVLPIKEVKKKRARVDDKLKFKSREKEKKMGEAELGFEEKLLLALLFHEFSVLQHQFLYGVFC